MSGGQLGPPCSAGEAVLGLQTMSCAHSKLRYCSAAQYGKEVVPLNEDMKRTLGYMPGPKARVWLSRCRRKEATSLMHDVHVREPDCLCDDKLNTT